jgi:energy-coupling factor transporter ATP-binding protein EcfA2
VIFTHLATQNFLGLPAFNVRFSPFTVFAGPNGSGKTSILNAIQFALDGQGMRGVETKKNYGDLLTDGAEKGYVEIGFDGRDVRRNVATGAIGKTALPPVPDILPWILQPSLFAQLPSADKRKALSRLLGLTTTLTTILERLAQQGVPENVRNDLQGPLGRGFDEAEKHARGRAAEARGAWQQLTGTNYGSKIAEDWAPNTTTTMRQHSPTEVIETLDATRSCKAVIAGLNQAIGAASRQLTKEARDGLQALADKVPEYEKGEQRGNARRIALVVEVGRLLPLTQGNGGTTTPCPHCGKPVVIDSGKLRVETEANPHAMADASRDLAAVRAELAEVDTKLAGLATSLRKARDASAALLVAPAGEAVDADKLSAELAANEDRLSNLVSLVNIHRNANAEFERLDGLADKARAEHQKVLAYGLAAEQLSPNGIPATLLGAVLDPFNAELATVCGRAGFPPITLDVNMNLRIGPRRYGLASESQKWRIDAVLARVFATLAKFPVMILDRIDVLDVPSRAEVFDWLLEEASSGIQIIGAATLKSCPPNDEGAVWVWLDPKTVGAVA